LLREWRAGPLHTAVFTHGHRSLFGGAMRGRRQWRRRSPAASWARSRPATFDRCRTAGYNTDINRRQFGIGRIDGRPDYRYPDETSAAPDARRRRCPLELRHAWRTDDRGCGSPVVLMREICSSEPAKLGNPQKAAMRGTGPWRFDDGRPRYRTLLPVGYRLGVDRARVNSRTRPSSSRSCTTTPPDDERRCPAREIPPAVRTAVALDKPYLLADLRRASSWSATSGGTTAATTRRNAHLKPAPDAQ
jgi:hypothetical protein